MRDAFYLPKNINAPVTLSVNLRQLVELHNSSRSFHFIHMRCYLLENTYKKIEH